MNQLEKKIDVLNNKVDVMSGIIHEMKPAVDDLVIEFRAMDTRMRFNEGQLTQHDVKIEGVSRTLDWHMNKHGETEGGLAPRKWLSTMELMASLPKFWHFLTLGGGLIAWLLYLTRNLFHG